MGVSGLSLSTMSAITPCLPLMTILAEDWIPFDEPTGVTAAKSFREVEGIR
jgi:hypothetical protein